MDVVNVEIANLDDLKKRFVEICATINRPGMEDLMAWLERSDFYTAPASTRFHGNYTGGLLEHTPTFSSIFAMKLGLLPSAMFALARLIWHGKTT